MTHVRGSLIQKADVRRPMQAQVESTTTSANAKHWKTACRERSNGAPQLFFDSQRQECCAKMQPRDDAISGAAAAQKCTMKERGARKRMQNV